MKTEKLCHAYTRIHYEVRAKMCGIEPGPSDPDAHCTAQS